MDANRVKHILLYAFVFISLCACQHTINGIGVDMENAGKKISQYSKKS